MTKPTHLKNIDVTSSSENVTFSWKKKFDLNGSVLLSNNQILITDWDNNKLKIIDIDKDKIISELQLSDCPYDVTKVEDNEVAVTLPNSNKIQFVSVSQCSLSPGREISVNGECYGITYYDKDQTLIVVVDNDIQILNMTGSVIKCLDKDSKGNKLFLNPYYVALSPTKKEIYVSDSRNHSITLMTMNGDVKDVYKDKSLQHPQGICYVHKSELVYVVGHNSHSVHQLDPESGEFEILLNQKRGIYCPQSLSYNEMEDKIYIGMTGDTLLKVFKMN